jgi:hypothetical protein
MARGNSRRGCAAFAQGIDPLADAVPGVAATAPIVRDLHQPPQLGSPVGALNRLLQAACDPSPRRASNRAVSPPASWVERVTSTFSTRGPFRMVVHLLGQQGDPCHEAKASLKS